MPPLDTRTETDSLERLMALRNTYQRHLACIVACSRSLLLCDAWHYDADRLDAVLSIGDHIRAAARGMQAIQHELGALESRLGVS